MGDADVAVDRVQTAVDNLESYHFGADSCFSMRIRHLQLYYVIQSDNFAQFVYLIISVFDGHWALKRKLRESGYKKSL